MNSFSLLLKPASFDCNLRCRYCFYLPKSEYFGTGAHRMSRALLEKVIRRYYDTGLELYQFGWQGGEPTLMGVPFFETAVKLQKQYLPPGGSFSNALQTNGTLLNGAWGAFLAANGFLVGVSIDGPRGIHDQSRRKASGAGTHAEVMRGVAVLKKHDVNFNALTLVSAANVREPEMLYRYLRDQGIRFHQYIECVEFDGGGRRQPWSVSAGEWGEFLCRLFDEWFRYDTHTVSVRLFDSMLSRLVSGIPTVCPMNGDCRNYFVVEHDGSVYPCDFFVRPETALGNLERDDFQTLSARSAYEAFGIAKKPRSPQCEACRWLPLCMGDCQKNRAGSDRSMLCEGWQLFYSHTIGRFEQLAAEIANGENHV